MLEEVCEHSIMGRGVEGYLDALSHLWALVTSPPATLAYGDLPDHVLDLRVPDQAEGWVMLIHGGFWREVYTRDTLDRAAVDLARRGFAVANIEYRRGPGTYPASVDDVAAAAQWLVDNGGDHGPDVGRIDVIGHSAGGFLATHLAGRRTDIRAVPVGAALDLVGVSEYRMHHEGDDPPAEYLGSTLDQDPSLWDQAAPTGPFRSPVHVVHGANDDVVPVDHSIAFAERWKVDLTVVDDGSHMDVVDPLEPAYQAVAGAISST